MNISGMSRMPLRRIARMNERMPSPVAWKNEMNAYAQAENGPPMQRIRRNAAP